MSKQAAKEIRNTIKSVLGLNSRDVSVRTSRCTLSSAVTVEIKTIAALKVRASIEAIAKGSEDVDRDASGYILGGGNTYVSTRPAPELVELMRQHVRGDLVLELRPGQSITLDTVIGKQTIKCVGFGHFEASHNAMCHNGVADNEREINHLVCWLATRIPVTESMIMALESHASVNEARERFAAELAADLAA